MTSAIEQELREHLEQLPPEQQQRVLDCARGLVRGRNPRGSGAALVEFAGSIPADDLTKIAQAVEEGCEQVNPDEWMDGHILSTTELVGRYGR